MTYSTARLLMLTGLTLIGSSGLAYAQADNRDVVRDTGGQIVHLDNGTCVRTKWLTDRDACAPPQRVAQQPIAQQPVAQQPVPPTRSVRMVSDLTQEDRTVYFKFNRSVLSVEAKQHLDTLARVLKSNESIKEAKIVGYADRIGSPAYNQKLSQKRAETVRSYLIARGYTNANVTETRWVGESEPSTHCPAMKSHSRLIACLHNDRRVEVEVAYLDQKLVPNAR